MMLKKKKTKKKKKKKKKRKKRKKKDDTQWETPATDTVHIWASIDVEQAALSQSSSGSVLVRQQRRLLAWKWIVTGHNDTWISSPPPPLSSSSSSSSSSTVAQSGAEGQDI